ncbi:unnamed protein product [Prunus armeniaca]|uniref:Uncharacterized protein n=1 Tax=Prunus armeniaca TaxID=36596 RepID=A0A6J5TJT2_PRUAR|nr:unnamed protein product [Prunus armeniaca]
MKEVGHIVALTGPNYTNTMGTTRTSLALPIVLFGAVKGEREYAKAVKRDIAGHNWASRVIPCVRELSRKIRGKYLRGSLLLQKNNSFNK